MSEACESLKSILDPMPVACMLHDRELRYTYWNPSAERTFEYCFEEAKGRHPFDLIALPAGEPAGDAFRALIAARGGQANCPAENQTKRDESSPASGAPLR